MQRLGGNLAGGEEQPNSDDAYDEENGKSQPN
jgi:hypothetical protein